MTLLYPLGLLGLISLPILAALHLFRERTRRMDVSSLMLWDFLPRQVHGTKPRRIPLTWLLLLDLMAGLLLSLALAQPQITVPVTVRTSQQHLLLLDTSASMLAVDGAGPRFEQSRAEATAILNSLQSGDSAVLVTFGSRANWIGSSNQLGGEEMLTRLANLKAGENGHALTDALGMAQAGLDTERPVMIHLFSDGAFADPGLQSIPYPIQLHPVGSDIANQAVFGASAREVSPGVFEIFARVANFSPRPATRTVRIQTDGETVQSSSVEIPANTSIPLAWTLRGAYTGVEISLAGNKDALSADDLASLGLFTNQTVQVLVSAEQDYPLLTAAQAVPEANARRISLAEYTPDPYTDAFLFEGALPTTLPAGAVFVVTPDESVLPGVRLESVSNTALVQINEPGGLLEGVDFSGVRWGKLWTSDSLPEETRILAVLQDGDRSLPLLIQRQEGSTTLTILLASLENGNLARHPAFPVLTGNFIRQSIRAELPTAITSGEPLPLPAPGPVSALHITLPGAANPQTFYRTWQTAWADTTTPGSYRIEMELATGKTAVQIIGVNAGSAEESNLTPQAWINHLPAGNNASSSANLTRSIDLAPWLLGVLILILFLEAVLAWR